MIILQTIEGREHQIEAGDRLVIYTDQTTVAFVSESGNPLFPTKRTDSKITVHAFASALGPYSLAIFIATLAGLKIAREDVNGNTIHRYVFENLP